MVAWALLRDEVDLNIKPRDSRPIRIRVLRGGFDDGAWS